MGVRDLGSGFPKNWGGSVLDPLCYFGKLPYRVR